MQNIRRKNQGGTNVIFNSLTFVVFFLTVYCLYISLQHRAQNLLLLVASLIFYGWWDWRFLALLETATVIDYCAGLAIDATENPRRRKLFLLVSMCSNLGILFFFKYFNFFQDSFLRLGHLLHFELSPLALHIVLPVGISFYTFQSMSYAIDIYRRQLKPTKNFFDFALYVSFFPQLVAGPIERAKHLLPQMQQERRITYPMFREGAWLILFGYFKKVVIADNLAVIANEVFNHLPSYRGLGILLGVYAFAFQIYGDFSGYSDIARGTARLMGFDLMYNFKMPYFAANPQDFWRRWHISLSTWLRDYLYIPLGGNKHGTPRTYLNLFLTMLLGGLWHGAAWHFVLWGAYQGALLIAHRGYHELCTGSAEALRKASRFGYAARVIIMFHFVCFGWILFRINAMSDVPLLIKNLFHWDLSCFPWAMPMLVLIAPMMLLDTCQEYFADMLVIKRAPHLARAAVYAVLLLFIFIAGKVNGFEFIYFQF